MNEQSSIPTQPQFEDHVATPPSRDQPLPVYIGESTPLPPVVDLIRTKQEVNDLYFPLLMIYLFGGINAGKSETEVRAALLERTSESERQLLAAVLCGLWDGLVKLQPGARMDEKVLATSLAQWFSTTPRIALERLAAIASDTTKPELDESFQAASRGLVQLRERSDGTMLITLMDQVGRWSGKT